MIPAQAEFMRDQFGGDFVLKTFANNNVDNTWMFRSGDVVLLVDEEWDAMTLKLGGSSHAVWKTGKVETTEQRIEYSRPSKNIAQINEMKKDILEDLFNGHSDLYDAWVEAFGEESVMTDSR